MGRRSRAAGHGPLIFVVLVAVALVLGGCGGSSKSLPGASNSPGPDATQATADTPAATPTATATATPVDPSLPTAWGQFRLKTGADGVVTKESAILAAAIAFGPIEGVDAPKGAPGGDFSASGPFRWLSAYWKDLDPKLQRAFRARFREIFPVAPGATTYAGGGTVMARVATADPFVDSPGAARYRAAVNKYIAAISAQLGRPLTLKTAISIPHKQFNDYFHASLWDEDGNQYEGCWITVSSAGENVSGQDLEFAIAHEVFHCFQYDVENFAKYSFAPAWIHEGQASWAGLAVAGPSELMADDSRPGNVSHWRGWLQQPEAMLFGRAFDAVGFYTLVQDAGGDVWSRLIPMLMAPGSTAAYGIATQGIADTVAKRWASSLFRDEKPSDAWNFKSGVGLSAKEGAPPPVQALTIANSQAVNADQVVPYAARIYRLSGPAEVVSLQSTGFSRIADEGSLDQAPDPGNTTNLCLRPQGCKCPEGSEGEATTQATAPLRWSLGGAGNGATATAKGTSLEDWCKKKATPTPVRGTSWNGTWQNTNVRQEKGTFHLVWTQNGNQLSGTIQVFDTPCLTDGVVSGTITGNQIQFGAVQGAVTIAYVGTMSGNTMQGTYQASAACASAQGLWTATKE